MNIHALTPTEASYLLFAIKKTLRDRAGLTPEMEQFYDSTYDALSSKLQRVSGSVAGDIPPPERYSYAAVRPSWGDITLNKKSRDQPPNSGEVGTD
jgi:hypothetical protein